MYFLHDLVLGPITSMAKLKLNMNPELDEPPFEVPKVDLSLEMEKLAVGITRAQYQVSFLQFCVNINMFHRSIFFIIFQRLIELADGMGAMTRGIPYRKFRPFNTRKYFIRFLRNSIYFNNFNAVSKQFYLFFAQLTKEMPSYGGNSRTNRLWMWK